MTADLPAPDDPVRLESPAPPENASLPPSLPSPAPPIARRAASGVALLALCGVLGYGTAQLLAVLGGYDVRDWWAPRPEVLGLDRMDRSVPVNAPAAAPAVPPRPAPAAELPTVRDHPPRPPAADLPRFALRDGEQYDFITDLDSEMMKRLDAVQERLERFGGMLGTLQQGVSALAEQAQEQRRAASAERGQVQQELAAARQRLTALALAVQDLEARLKREPAQAGGAPGGAPAPGWSVTAISGARAWLRTPQGGTVTVTAGERLKALGVVRAVDPRRRIVVLEDGRYVR